MAALFVFAGAQIIVNIISNRLDQALPEWLAGWLTWPWLLGLAALVGLASWVATNALRGRPAHERTRPGSMIAAIDDIDPLDVGVATATQNVVVGGRLPTYQSRDVDPQLDEAVTAAVSGRGDWVIVIEGDTAVGKTRTLFEALRAHQRRNNAMPPAYDLVVSSEPSRPNRT